MVVISSLQTYECLHCRQTGGAVHFITQIENIIKWDFLRSDKRVVRHSIGTVYVLELQNGCFYIGFTKDLVRRLKQHFTSKGVLWTQRNPPVKLLDVYYDVPEFVEHRVTKRYIDRSDPKK